jgi:hypothetical protein
VGRNEGGEGGVRKEGGEKSGEKKRVTRKEWGILHRAADFTSPSFTLSQLPRAVRRGPEEKGDLAPAQSAQIVAVPAAISEMAVPCEEVLAEGLAVNLATQVMTIPALSSEPAVPCEEVLAERPAVNLATQVVTVPALSSEPAVPCQEVLAEGPAVTRCCM